MSLQKRIVYEWAITRARAVRSLRGVRRGVQVVCDTSGWVRLQPFEILAPGPGEILVRTLLSAVSPGTERAEYNRLPNTGRERPYTPGYSGVGVVVETGRAVRSTQAGDRVAGTLPHASLAVVRADRCRPVPEGVGDAEAAFLTLGVIALQGVRKAGIRWADRVAVLGRGALGMLCARLARLAAPGEVALLGRGLSAVAGDQEPAPALSGIAAGRRFDVVLDVTGNPEALADAARLVAPGGRIVLVGSPRGASPALPERLLRSGALEIRGAHAQMLAERTSLPGRWTFGDEAELYLDLLSSGTLHPFDPPAERIDPAEAWSFYRRLGKGEPPLGAALFDWGRVAESSRSRASTFRPPQEVWKPDLGRDRVSRWPGRVARRAPRPIKGAAMATGRTIEEKPLGVAILGCGDVAIRNAIAVVDSRSAALRWAIDPNLGLAEDLTKRYGGRAATATAAALEDGGVDVVFICAPHHLHARLGLEAVAAGKHVIVEKPMARDGGEAASLVAAAREAKVLLTACYPMRFLPQVLGARRLVQDGALGRVLGAKIAEHLYREMSYWYGGASGRNRSSWRAQKESSGGGVLLMNLCHHLDTLFFVTGLRARRVYCEMDRFSAPGDVEDAVVLAVRLAGGAIAAVDASTCSPGGGESLFQIWGSEGQIALEPPPRFLTLKRHALGGANAWNRLPVGTEAEARRDFVRSFVAAIRGSAPNPVPPEEALYVQQLIGHAYRSAELGAPVAASAESDRSADALSNS